MTPSEYLYNWLVLKIKLYHITALQYKSISVNTKTDNKYTLTIIIFQYEGIFRDEFTFEENVYFEINEIKDIIVKVKNEQNITA